MLQLHKGNLPAEFQQLKQTRALAGFKETELIAASLNKN
jgi:hypothetical protein